MTTDTLTPAQAEAMDALADAPHGLRLSTATSLADGTIHFRTARVLAEAGLAEVRTVRRPGDPASEDLVFQVHGDAFDAHLRQQGIDPDRFTDYDGAGEDVDTEAANAASEGLPPYLIYVTTPTGDRVVAATETAKDRARKLAAGLTGSSYGKVLVCTPSGEVIAELDGEREPEQPTAAAPKPGALAPLIEAGKLQAGHVLSGTHKGVIHTAVVLPTGELEALGEVHRSPSAAGKAARGIETNGWTFWQVSDDATLADLRAELA